MANYRATGRDDTIRVLNTSTDDDDNFRFADGTGVQKSSDLPNQFFVSFTEVGSCDSYDQYANDHGNCNAFNRPPVLPGQDSDYLQGKCICNHIKIIKFLFKSLKLIMIIMLLSVFAKT